MTERQPKSTKNLDSNHYGLEPVPWSRVRDHLISDTPKAETAAFLGTVRPDGTPHAAGIGPLWVDGNLWFTSSPTVAKTRHLAANPACTLSIRLVGTDVVFEGTAMRVTDRTTVEKVQRAYAASGWPAALTPEGDAITAPYSAPSAGPPPWYVFRMDFHTAFAVSSEEPGGATRWTFD